MTYRILSIRSLFNYFNGTVPYIIKNETLYFSKNPYKFQKLDNVPSEEHTTAQHILFNKGIPQP